MQQVPSLTCIRSFLKISVNYIELADTDRGLGTRNGLSSCRSNGTIGKNSALHPAVNPELELGPVPPQLAVASRVAVVLSRPRELEL